MKKIKNAGMTLTACVLIIALAVTFAACGKAKAEQPDLPYGLKFGQSYDEVVKVFEDKGVKFCEEEITIADKKLIPGTCSRKLKISLKYSEIKPEDFKNEISKVDFNFFHSSKLVENFRASDINSPLPFVQQFYFTDENKLYYINITLPDLWSEIDLSEAFLYYADLFRKEPTRHELVEGLPSWSWENEKYFVHINCGPAEESSLAGVTIGLQME